MLIILLLILSVTGVLAYAVKKVIQSEQLRKRLEDQLSLEATVRSLIEVVREESAFNVSVEIICSTLSRLLRVAGMSIYQLNSKQQLTLLGESLDKNSLLGDFISGKEEIIKETILHHGQSSSLSIKNFALDKAKFPKKQTCLNVLFRDSLPSQLNIFVVTYIVSHHPLRMEKLRPFILQALFYAAQLISILFDKEKLKEADKLLRQKEENNLHALELAQKLESEIQTRQSQNELIGFISHEFRTPLSVIGSSVRLIQMSIQELDYILHKSKSSANNLTIQETTELKKIFKQVEYINEYVFKLSNLIDNTFNLSMVEHQDNNPQYLPMEIDLNIFLQELVNRFQHIEQGAKISFLPDMSNTSHTACFDAKHLELVLSNLLSNAVKFSNNDTEIKVRLSCQPDICSISVEDQGIGISREALPNLFTKFFRAPNAKRIRGSGIGLYLAKKLADINHATLTATSKLNKGTTFTLTLPRNSENFQSNQEVANV